MKSFSSTFYCTKQCISKVFTLSFSIFLLLGCGGGSNTESDPPQIVVEPPSETLVANAGDNMLVNSGQTVTLDAINSQIPSASSVSYEWEQINGTRVNLENSSARTANFVAHDLVGVDELIFQLTLTDASGTVSTDNILVRLEPQIRLTQAITLNDTGQVKGANYPIGINETCTGESIAQQDCSHGRDILFPDDDNGHAGFDFTKLDSSGSALESTALVWSCVQDNVTGLTWEVKTNDGTARDIDLRYRWGGAGAPAYGTEFYDDWDTLIDSANVDILCGYDDWRVPTAKEFQSILSYDRIDSIDERFFIYEPNCCWTVSADYGEQSAKITTMKGGFITNQSRDSASAVILVRGDIWQ